MSILAYNHRSQTHLPSHDRRATRSKGNFLRFVRFIRTFFCDQQRALEWNPTNPGQIVCEWEIIKSKSHVLPSRRAVSSIVVFEKNGNSRFQSYLNEIDHFDCNYGVLTPYERDLGVRL